MSARAEYLENFRSPLIEDIDGQACLKLNLILAPWALQSVLTQARDYAVSAPGPNLNRRELLIPSWLDFWIRLAENFTYASETQLLVVGRRAVQFEQIGEVLDILHKKGQTSGVLNAAGMEGYWGHQKAIDYMAAKVDAPILLLEGQEYFIRHPERRKHFLPLLVRISMWALYSGIGLISVSPPKAQGASESEHYQNVFQRTEAMFNFAEAGDPHEFEKRARGKWAAFTQIPHFDEFGNLRTSNIVEKLM